MSLALLLAVVVTVFIGLISACVYVSTMSASEHASTNAAEPHPPSAPVDTREETTVSTEAPPSASAAKNKANSYYYWHGHEKERAKLGDVAPLPTPHLVSKDDAVTVTLPVVPAISVSKYSWCDGEKFVSVYVQTAPPASGEVLDEASVAATFTRSSFKITFSTTDAAGNKRTKQMITRLSKRIDTEKSSTKVKAKTQEILVKLAKRRPNVWIDLEGNASDRDSDADEPLEEANEDEDE